TLGNSNLAAKILAPPSASFTCLKSHPLPGSPHPPRQSLNDGISKLAVVLREVQDIRLTVLLEPVAKGQRQPFDPLEVKPLSAWP
ncbi:MAG: hypothetical protein LUP91_16280, partial [Methylococcaceae bacterium]|nr:hypothetical protein [Methylococcaceae bacterium]